jgi:hypothetical protein
MKSLLLILALSFYQTSFTQRGNASYALDAYIIIQGTWVHGTISVNRTQNGDKPFNYNFDGFESGSLYPDSRFTPLNPNNQYAIKNNFTHTISIPNLGTAYVTM